MRLRRSVVIVAAFFVLLYLQLHFNWVITSKTSQEFATSACRDPVIATRLCEGLMNQHGSLVSVVMLARVLNVSVLLPTVFTRTGVDDNVTDIQFDAIPFESFYDKQYILAKHRYITDVEYGQYNVVQSAPRFRNLDSQEIIATYGPYFQNSPCNTIVQLPCPFLTYKPNTNRDRIELAKLVTQQLPFNHQLVRLANRIVKALGGKGSFTSAHLRVEKDGAHVWDFRLAVKPVLDFLAMRPPKALYVASGIFASKVPSVTQSTLEPFQRMNFPIHNKQTLIDPEELSIYSIEQLAVVDFLVCLQSDYHIGPHFSSFSYFIGYFRKSQRLPSCIFSPREEAFDIAFPLQMNGEK